MVCRVLLGMGFVLAVANPSVAASMKKGKANISGISVSVDEDAVYHFRIFGSLPDACTLVEDVLVEKNGNEWVVTVTTARPVDKMCATMMVPFERELDEVRPEKGSSGTVIVNGVRRSFSPSNK